MFIFSDSKTFFEEWPTEEISEIRIHQRETETKTIKTVVLTGFKKLQRDDTITNDLFSQQNSHVINIVSLKITWNFFLAYKKKITYENLNKPSLKLHT